MLKQGPDFLFEDKRLFEITEVEMTRVDCMLDTEGEIITGDYLHATRLF